MMAPEEIRAMSLKLAVKIINKKTAYSPNTTAKEALELSEKFVEYIANGRRI